MRLRTGRRIGRNLYLQAGPDPSEDDPLIGHADTPELAAFITAAVDYFTRWSESKTGDGPWTSNQAVLDRLTEPLAARAAKARPAGPVAAESRPRHGPVDPRATDPIPPDLVHAERLAALREPTDPETADADPRTP